LHSLQRQRLPQVFALPSASVALAHAQHTTTPAVPLVEASCTASDAVDELLAVGVGVDHADELKKLRRQVNTCMPSRPRGPGAARSVRPGAMSRSLREQAGGKPRA